MSNLESKTLKQILDESNIAYSFKGWAGDSQLILNQKYVAEVFVQKEIAELKLVADSAHKNAQWTMDANRRQVEHIKALEAKIEAAKPLLEKWCRECGESEFENICENDCTVHELKALLFPRKEEEGCPPDRAYCGTDDSSGKKCQYFDDCKQPKEEAKTP